MPVELVIFDCDGVLIDSERIAVRIDAEALAALGWPLGEHEVIQRFVGRSDEYMLGEIESHLGRPVPEAWVSELHRRYREAIETELTAVDGIVAVLDHLTIPTCVASSGSHDKMRHTLGRTGLYNRFSGRIFSASEVRNGKPAPDLFLHAARRMGVEPSACAVVEDSKYGVQGASAAGMRAFGYAGGVTPADWLEAAGAVVFHDMRELPDLLDRCGSAVGDATRG